MNRRRNFNCKTFPIQLMRFSHKFNQLSSIMLGCCWKINCAIIKSIEWFSIESGKFVLVAFLKFWPDINFLKFPALFSREIIQPDSPTSRIHGRSQKPQNHHSILCSIFYDLSQTFTLFNPFLVQLAHFVVRINGAAASRMCHKNEDDKIPINSSIFQLTTQ